MEKKIILIFLIFVFCVQIAHADQNITIKNSVYSNGDSVTEFDWDDDILYVTPGTTLQIRMTYENSLTQDIEVTTRATLDLISNNDDESKKTTIPAEDYASSVIELAIPDTTKYGTYDLNLRYKYDINGTQYEERTTLEVNIKKVSLTQPQTNDLWLNLTRELVDTKAVTNSLLATNHNCTYELATCKQELGTKESECTGKEDFKSMYQQKCTDYDSVNMQLSDCKTQAAGKVSDQECLAREDKARQDGKSSATTTALIIGGAGGIVLFFWYQSQKKKDSQPEGESLRGRNY